MHGLDATPGPQVESEGAMQQGMQNRPIRRNRGYRPRAGYES